MATQLRWLQGVKNWFQSLNEEGSLKGVKMGGGEGNCFLIDCSFGRERGRVGGALSNEIR